jgi:hypothetical protein
MVINSQIKKFNMFWPPICEHTYERVSRMKWRIQLNYKCGAETILEDHPDDFIQYMVLGAYNSGLEITTNLNHFPADRPPPAEPVILWSDFQPLILE